MAANVFQYPLRIECLKTGTLNPEWVEQLMFEEVYNLGWLLFV